MSYSTEWRKIKEPSESMKDHYAMMFRRNQMKFMKRSPLKPDHIGSEFKFEESLYRLIGTATPVEMVIENMVEGSFYMVHCDLVTRLILGE